jgi:hypothetical protein
MTPELYVHTCLLIITSDESVCIGKGGSERIYIEDEAGDAGLALAKTFIATVTHHSLKIRLYWAGKGTTGIYG